MNTDTKNDFDLKTSKAVKWFIYGFALSMVTLNVRGIAGFFYSAV